MSEIMLVGSIVAVFLIACFIGMVIWVCLAVIAHVWYRFGRDLR